MSGKLSDAERRKALDELAGWDPVSGRDAIAKTYQFRNFREAFGWMTKVAEVADRMDHHPEWRNVYRTVEVVLTSHDSGGVTERDLKLAREMDRLLAEGTDQGADTPPSHSETGQGGASLDDAQAQPTATP